MVRHARVSVRMRMRTGLPGMDPDGLWPPPVRDCDLLWAEVDDVPDFYSMRDRRGEATGLEFRRWQRLVEHEAELARYEEGE